MNIKMLLAIAGVAVSALMLVPEPAEAQRGFRAGGFGGVRGVGVGRVGIGRAGIGRVGIGRVGIGRVGIGRVGIGRVGYRGLGYRGVGIGYRGLGVRRAAIGWGGPVGIRRGLAWRGHYPYYGWRRPYWGYGAAAVIGAGLLASSYGYGYGYPYDYGYGPAVYGDGYYGGCPLVRRVVLTEWGYREVLVQACY
jgi:hypothetical protein